MTPEPQEEDRVPLAGRRIAIIEDDLTTAMVAEGICRKLGAQTTVVCADGGCVAAALTDPFAPVDIVLLDMMLGREDGLAALRSIDARGFKAEIIPVSSNDPRVLDAAVRLLAGRGFKVHAPIQKPLTAEKLGRSLRGRPKRAGGEAEKAAQPRATELAAALARDEFVPFYQLKCDTRSLRPIGVELLARWQHPGRGLLGAGEFVPGLEASGLIAPATERLLVKAAADLAGFDGALGLAINVSAPTLVDHALPDRLKAIVTAHGIAPERITFEITESALSTDTLALLESAARLRLHGFRLAIDDFGTGWSSLDQLQRLPFTELKIDRSFVAGAPRNGPRRVILASTVAMAKGLGLSVVAEGVETEEERALLETLGVNLIQGWLTGRPLAAHDLAAQLAAVTPDATTEPMET